MLDRDVFVDEASLLPWSNRTAEEWQSFISPEESARLFLLAQRNDGTPSWMENWRLEVAFQAHFEGDCSPLEKAMEDAGQKFLLYPVPQDRLDHYSNELSTVFIDPSTYTFLLKARQSINQPGDLVGRVSEELGWDDTQTEVAKYNYNRIVELFFEDALRFSELTQRDTDDEECVDRAGEFLTRAVLNYYWEPFVIDPKWTTQRFIRSMKGWIKGRDSLKTDVSGLIVPMNEVHERRLVVDHSEGVEVKAIDRAEASSVLAPLMNDPQAVQIIQARAEGLTYPEIAARVGCSNRMIKRVMKAARESYRELAPEEAQSREVNIWDDLFERTQFYRDLYQKQRMRLQPFRRIWMDKFFEALTDDKQSTLDELSKHFPNIQRDTLRRQIFKRINILLNREKQGHNGGDLKKGGPWQRHSDAIAFKKAAEDPYLWSQFTDKEQEILIAYYFKDPEQKIKGYEVGEIVGISEGRVSRHLMNCRKKLTRLTTHSKGWNKVNLA